MVRPGSVGSTGSPEAFGPAGPEAWIVPVVPASMRCTHHSARSRTSMSCTVRPGSPGASTSPPRMRRAGQYVKRSLASKGPTINPGRTTSARALASAARFRTTRSQRALSGPYIAYIRSCGIDSPAGRADTSRSCSGESSAVGASSASPIGPRFAYAEMLET